MLLQLQFNQLIKSLYRLMRVFVFGAVFIMASCSSDDDENIRIFEATFEGSGAGLAAEGNSTEVQVQFSLPTIAESTVTIEVVENGVSYDTDYQTTPAVSDGLLEITVPAGSESASFTVTRLVEFIEAGNNVTFTLLSIDGEEDPQLVGTTSYTVSFEKVVSQSGVIDLQTGGSTQPNQVYIDLSTGMQTAVRRDTWELGFYNGAENRIFLNAANRLSAARVEGVTDLNSVTSETELESPLTLYSFGAPVEVVTVSDLIAGLPLGYAQYGDEENGVVFTDEASGNLEGTAIEEVSTTDSENNVYVISLGTEIPEESADPGAINTYGDHRGFMKIRVLTDGDSYTIQYAELDATTFQEATIEKDPSYILTAFSLVNETTVDVEPMDWDINFSGVFSFYSGGYGLTYADYGLHNTLGGVGAYRLVTEDFEPGVGETIEANTEISYQDFTFEDVEEEAFVYDDRTVINSDWRSTSEGVARDYVYFIVKDTDGNYYKLQFTALLSEDGERGYSQFQYELLQ